MSLIKLTIVDPPRTWTRAEWKAVHRWMRVAAGEVEPHVKRYLEEIVIYGRATMRMPGE